MTIYNADNVKVTIGGVELKGCTNLEFNSQKIKCDESEGWLNLLEQPRITGTMEILSSAEDLAQAWKEFNLAYAARKNRAPRGMRRYK